MSKTLFCVIIKFCKTKNCLWGALPPLKKITRDEGKSMKELEKKINYRFKEDSIIERAFTHSSYTNEAEEKSVKSYERLEFLGDAILDLAVSEILFKRFPDLQEGVLSKMRSRIVCEDSLYLIAKDLELGSYIKFSKGEERSGGRERKSILADVVESMIAVIYLEASYAKVMELVETLFDKVIHSVSERDTVDDYKSMLQIWAQAHKRSIPVYRVKASSGPEHDKTFLSVVLMDGEEIAVGRGKSKRASEQEAAREAYRLLSE